jgi:putative aldouronate transport system permease protein
MKQGYRKKQSASSMNLFDLLLLVLMSLFMLTVIYPFWDLLMRSFSSPTDSANLGFNLFPKTFTTASYRAVIERGTILINYQNTLFRTIAGTGLSLLIITCAAFSLAKRDLPFRTPITFFLIFTLFFSGGIIPSFLLIKNLGLIDSIWSLILPTLAGVYNMIMVRNYIQSLDRSLEESAIIDGASQTTVLFRIIVPVCKPILATVALWIMVGHWNAWFDALLYTNKPSLEVLQLSLRKLLISTSSLELQRLQQTAGDNAALLTTESLKASQVFITILPILFAYPFLQRYFVKGIMVGSFKG